MQLLLLLLLSPWPSSSQSCCSDLLITSSGGAADHQSHRLGSYLVTTTDVSGRPIYKHQEREQFLFYLQSRSKGLWMVGPKVGQFDGGLASPADPHCVEDVPGGGWRYTDGSAWYRDSQLRVTCQKQEENKFSQTEINGKFKITSLNWEESLRDPNSEQFRDLANTIEDDISAMIRDDKELDDQADFTVSVKNFKKGSVVVDFKVNYVLKEAYIAIPFAIKPANISEALGNNFQFQTGILFQRFLIAADSFNSSSPADHCSAKGCSHKCDYDYDREEYVCTCPGDFTIHSDGLNCVTEEEDADYGGVFTTSISETNDANTELNDSELTVSDVQVLITTKRVTTEAEEIVNRIGITDNIVTTVTTKDNVEIVESSEIAVKSVDSVTESGVDILTTVITTVDSIDEVVTTERSIENTNRSDEKVETGTIQDISNNIQETTTISILHKEVTKLAFIEPENEVRISTLTAPEVTTKIVLVLPTETVLEITTENSEEILTKTETAAQASTGIEEGISTESAVEITTVISAIKGNTTSETVQDKSTEIPREISTATAENITENTGVTSTETSETTDNPQVTSTVSRANVSTETAADSLKEKAVEISTETAENITTDTTDVTPTETVADLTTEDMTKEIQEVTENPNITSTETLVEISTEIAENITTDTAEVTLPTTAEKITTENPKITLTETAEEISTEPNENVSTETADEISTDISIENTSDIPTTTTASVIESGVYEFDCVASGQDEEGEEELSLECKEREGESGEEGRRTAYIVIDKTNVEGDISRIWEDNVRLVVKKVVVEDISPK